MDKPIKVTCYAGYKADERPTSFTWEGATLEVIEVVDRWYDQDANYFKVLAEDGNEYLLRHDLNSDSWTVHEPEPEPTPDQNG